MNWFTLIVNSLIVGNLVVQHQQMLRLHRYRDLDSSRMHHLFRTYFYLCFMFAITSIDLHHFKLPSSSESVITLENMIYSVGVLVISFVYILSMHTSQPLDSMIENPYFSEELERQLLLSTETFKSVQPVVQITSSPVKPPSQYSVKAMLRSKDISPIQSYGNSNLSPQNFDQSSVNRGRKFSAVKTPILATLLNSESVIAIMGEDQNLNSNWMTALPIMITIFYILSQYVYSISVIRTSVNTPYKPYLMSGLFSVLLGLVIGVTTLLNELSVIEPCSSLIQSLNTPIINYSVGLMLMIQGIIAVAYYFILTRKRPAFYPSEIHSVQVYNSISSPSLHSVY